MEHGDMSVDKVCDILKWVSSVDIKENTVVQRAIINMAINLESEYDKYMRGIKDETSISMQSEEK